MIWKIADKHQATPIKHLSKNNFIITDKKNIADLLAETFPQNSSSQNCKPKFIAVKQNAEKYKLNFKSKNQEQYNNLFSLKELKDSIKRSQNTAVGQDEVHNEFLRQLPSKSLKLLLRIYNKLWTEGKFLDIWRQTPVIAIPKQGKDNLHPQNYRPISLTSCLCKIKERIINDRLVWYLESNGLISNLQCRFHSKRCTTDHLVHLETVIREAFIRNRHLAAIFFDLEKAYDTTWKYGIMKDLHDFGLKGRLPHFISEFLSDCKFKGRIGSTLSDMKNQEERVP